jgi:Asp-tRNA(Asn)/Glu-tRNA(Gln) amidotransferase A subunit family amidase
MTLTTATELWRMSATELAEAIRSRQVSSQEVIEAHLARIEGGQRLDQRRCHCDGRAGAESGKDG